MPKFPFPNSVPSGNAHNLVLHLQSAPRDDAERVVQIGAEGITSARRACAGLDGLPADLARATRASINVVRNHAAARDIFANGFRDAARELVLACDGWLTINGDDPEVVQMRQLLLDAAEASELVEDVAAAERLVGALRAGRRGR